MSVSPPPPSTAIARVETGSKLVNFYDRTCFETYVPPCLPVIGPTTIRLHPHVKRAPESTS